MNSEEAISATNVKIDDKSTIELFNDAQNDQDFKQKSNVVSTLILEIYRVLMGAFLMVFVPQKCGDTVCTISDNISRNDVLSITAISCNSITLLTFLCLYFIEVKRENKLITYLEVNKFEPLDNDSVGTALKKISPKKTQTIWNYDRYYQKAGYCSTIAFVINAIISSVVVYSHYLDTKTVTVYLTNVLFMGTKVYDVYTTVNTKRNIFYSAYLKNKVQYNDVDPDKLIENSKSDSENNI